MSLEKENIEIIEKMLADVKKEYNAMTSDDILNEYYRSKIDTLKEVLVILKR